MAKRAPTRGRKSRSSARRSATGAASAKTSSRRPSSSPADRLPALRAAFKPTGATHLLVTDPKDVGYLTGFHGGDSYLIVPATPRPKPVLISDRRYEEELEEFASITTIRMRTGSMFDAVRDICRELKVGRLAVQAEHLSVSAHKSLTDRIGVRKVVPTTSVLADLRLRKDDTEIAAIRAAIRVQESALEVALGDIAPGQTELEVCASLEWAMKSLGATAVGFETIIAAGPNSAKPHYRPGKVKLKNNSLLLIDFGAVVGGYTGDMTRTFALGKWPKPMAQVYDIVLEAHQLAAAALAPGKSGAEVDAVARRCITAHGYGEQFAHSLGHGIGLNVHEGPRLSALAQADILKPGMVVTIEPGIYIPGVGGVRLENDYLITERGAKNLCTLPMDRDWATLT